MAVDDRRGDQWRILAARFTADASLIDNLCERAAAPPRERAADLVDAMAVVAARWTTVATRTARAYRDQLAPDTLLDLHELAARLQALTTALSTLPDRIDPERATRPAWAPITTARGVLS